MRMCRSCGREVDAHFRFCPDCGTPLRLKVVDHFRGVDELGDGWLRVSVYLTKPQHVRFSVWRGDRVQAAMSLSPEEAQRLAAFLNGLARRTGTGAAARIRQSAVALRDTIFDLAR